VLRAIEIKGQSGCIERRRVTFRAIAVNGQCGSLERRRVVLRAVGVRLKVSQV